VRALLVDAAGTLLHPREPVAKTYADYARRHGVHVDEALVKERFKEALRERPSGPRYVGDARPFWRSVVARCTGSSSEALFEELYGHFALPEAWTVAGGAPEAFAALRAAGKKVAVVSNWDDRLPPLLAALGLTQHLDDVIVSSEVGLEKPDPAIFRLACARLGVAPAEAIHVGNDPVEDVQGARTAGCAALLWGSEVRSFREVARRIA
jgi:REG-2-like HAD superfamily hydrolase